MALVVAEASHKVVTWSYEPIRPSCMQLTLA